MVFKAREEFSRMAEQVKDDVLLPGPVLSDSCSSNSKFFSSGFIATDQASASLIT